VDFQKPVKFVVRKPGSRAKFLAALRRKLPFEAEVAFCDGSDLIRLEMENPFGPEPLRPDAVRFVSILSKAGPGEASFPIAIPEDGEWFVRIIGSKNRLVCGVYRRHVKTIGYLGPIDKVFGAPATTRSWNTILFSAATFEDLGECAAVRFQSAPPRSRNWQFPESPRSTRRRDNRRQTIPLRLAGPGHRPFLSPHAWDVPIPGLVNPPTVGR